VSRETVQDIIVDGIIVIVVTYQVYMIVDQVTDGRLSRDLSVKWVKATAKLRETYEREKAVRKSIGRVLFDAITTVESEDPRNTGRDTEGA
jgi:hypothetical protein